MKIRNEYEVTAYPDGSWTIRHIRGEEARQVASGNAQKGMPFTYDTSTLLQRAERAARDWINEKKAEEKKAREVAKGAKTFTVKA